MNSDLVTLDLDEKKFLGLKERLDACKDHAMKLHKIQLLLDMTGEKGDVVSMERELGLHEMKD